MTPSCHPSHVASQAKAEKTPCHKHTQALSHTHTDTYIHTHAHTGTCAHTCLRVHTCADAQVLARAHPHTHTHTRPAPAPRDAGAGATAGRPGPMSLLTSSLAQLVPVSPWGPGPLASGRLGGRAWRHEARLATLPLGHSAPHLRDPHVGAPAWVVVQPPGRPLFPSRVSSRRTASPSPPGRGPRLRQPPCQHRPSHSPALSTTSPCPVGPRAPPSQTRCHLWVWLPGGHLAPAYVFVGGPALEWRPQAPAWGR